MNILPFINVAEDLELAGLLWRPEIGDEVSDRRQRDNVSILVDPQGLTPGELRSTFIWLPTVEQMVLQLEVRQAVLAHAGLEMDERAMFYKTVIKTNIGPIESKAQTLRIAMGLALRNLLLAGHTQQIN
ncbi:MAG: hypothetical protein K1X79_11870 [Oligoflexia bacterium]|nr:hypothetical protein [Oligoflexia bacterium]